MEESFSAVSCISLVNAKSGKSDGLYRCNITSPSLEDYANMNTPLGSELSCTNERNYSSSQPKSDHSIKEYGDSVGLTEVSSSDENGSCGDTNLKLDLDLTLWVNHVKRKHTSPEPNPPIAGGMEQARILTVGNFQVPSQSRQDNINMYSDSRNMVNAEDGFERRYHKTILGQPKPVQCSDSVTIKENQHDTPVVNWNLAFSLNTSRQSQSFATNHFGMASVDGLCNTSQEKANQLSSFDHNFTNDHFTVVGDSSTTKGEVIGWPPIQAHRRNSLGSLPKPSGENQQGAIAGSFVQGHKNSLYVKVNMDGMPIGRKVDLNAFESYENLAQDLENMFQLTTENHIRACIPMGNTHVVEPLRLLDPTTDFVLTYEDSEGDCMLIGDVPWKMFLHTVKRLRIMKNLGTNAFAQKCSKKRKAT